MGLRLCGCFGRHCMSPLGGRQREVDNRREQDGGCERLGDEGGVRVGLVGDLGCGGDAPNWYGCRRCLSSLLRGLSCVALLACC